MRRRVGLPGGALERAVLEALWKLGRATARELHDRVGEPGGLVYTTTAKVLDRLCAKGLVARRRIGRTFLYTPRAERATVEKALARGAIRRILGSEPRPAIATLVDAVESIDPDLLDELMRAVEARRRSPHGS